MPSTVSWGMQKKNRLFLKELMVCLEKRCVNISECLKYSVQLSAIMCELDFRYLRNLGKGEVIISWGNQRGTV